MENSFNGVNSFSKKWSYATQARCYFVAHTMTETKDAINYADIVLTEESDRYAELAEAYLLERWEKLF